MALGIAGLVAWALAFQLDGVLAGCAVAPQDYLFLAELQEVKEDIIAEPGTTDGCWHGAGLALQVVYRRAKDCRTSVTPCKGFSLEPQATGWRSCLLTKAYRPPLLPITDDLSCRGVFKRVEGQVIGWGDWQNGQTVPPPEAQYEVAAVSAGGFHSLAMLSNNRVVGWGMDDHGQATVPTEAQTDVANIAAGWMHSLAVLNSGRVVAWGSNDLGAVSVPEQALSGVVDVAAGQHHSVALLETGEVLAWGSGQSLLVPPDIQTRTVAIAAGVSHSFALLDNGTVVGWGYNIHQQLDVPLVAQSKVVAVAAGGGHSLALLSNGTVVAWGGADGLGVTDVPEAARSNVMAIAASIYYSIALLNNGTVVSWGSQVRQRLLRVPPTAMADVAAIATRGAHSLAIVLPPPRLVLSTQDSLSTEETAGIVLACLVGSLCLGIAAVLYVWHRRQKRKEQEQETSHSLLQKLSVSRNGSEDESHHLVTNPLFRGGDSSLNNPLFQPSVSMLLAPTSSGVHTSEVVQLLHGYDEVAMLGYEPHHADSRDPDGEPLLYPQAYGTQPFYQIPL